MESSLHRDLKIRYGTGCGGRCEVVVDGFRIDAVDGDGVLIEVQSASLGALKPKLRRLLPLHRVHVVRPMILERVIVRRDRFDGPDVSRRRSPKRGVLEDVFDDLVGIASFLSHPNLTMELLGVTSEEVRVPRRRGRGAYVADRLLLSITTSLSIRAATDLWKLLPVEISSMDVFTTADLARKLGRPLAFAQRIAYCLRLAGVARQVGKRGNSLLYQSAEPVVLER